MTQKRFYSSDIDDYVVAHDEPQAEADFDFMDFTSNGFKQRHTSSHANGDGEDYVYMAFANKIYMLHQKELYQRDMFNNEYK